MLKYTLLNLQSASKSYTPTDQIQWPGPTPFTYLHLHQVP